MDYRAVANHPFVWIACGVPVAIVLAQALLFLRKAWQVAPGLGIGQDQIKRAIRASIISSIGPSLAIVAGMVTLLVSLGGAVSWGRMGMIGSVGYDLMAAGFGAAAVGTPLGSPDFNSLAFSNAVLTMSVGTLGYLAITGLFTTKLERGRDFLAGGCKALVPIISTAAMLGAFAYLNMEQVFSGDSKKIASLVTGFVVMILFSIYEKRTKARWSKEWSLTIAMFAGMFVTVAMS